MKLSKTALSLAIGISVLGAGLAGCGNSMEVKSDNTSTAKKAVNNNDFYEVHSEDGRIYLFDDQKTYLSFLSVGETSYRLTRIGAGPKGETVVFGLHKKDKKKRSGIASVDMYEGRLEAGNPFYGELIKHNRYYVFSSWEDMKFVRKIGEPSYMYSDIGAGPKGETVVYVLNKSNKKKKPTALVSKFKSVHK